ncbi:MAG: cytochrome P450 [bacterium]|nr:cytochrome P450 [Deltaproteobacteria bacterium]MCP4905478.1 cytochrome P450 [bacterium]
MNDEFMLFPEIDFAWNEVLDLHALLAKARESGPVVRIRYHDKPAYLVLSHEAVGAGLSDEEHFPSPAFHTKWSMPTMGRTLQCMTGDEHRRTRSLVNSAFRPSVMKRAVEGLLEPVAHQLIDDFVADGHVEIIEGFAHRYPAKIIMRMLGLPDHDETMVLRWALDLINYPWQPNEALQSSREFTAYLAEVVRERRLEPREDLLSELCRGEVDGDRLSDEEIFSLVRLLFPAGADTTYKALGSFCWAVLTQTELSGEVASDPALRSSLIEETLRWEPPIALQPRTARGQPFSWFGAEIPADAAILLAITAANRDPEIFSDPDRFDPERNARSILTFGRGTHFCLGTHLARREMDVATKAIFERCRGLRLAASEPVEVVGAILRGPKALHVEFEAA